MYQLALAFKDLGVKVVGYDIKESKYTKICAEQGIKVVHNFNKDFCCVDLCVKTGAVKKSKYINTLKKRGVPIVDRAEVLSWFCSKFKQVIAVAGTHGKSTTASLIYEILRQDGRKVSCHIGADVFAPRFNFGDDYLVVEACEYNKSFLSLYPHVSVVTNIEAEHMDSYGSVFNLRNAFSTFIKRANKRFVFLDDSTKFLKRIKNIEFVKLTDLKFKPKIKGEYNLKNISLASAVCLNLGVNEEIIINAVNSFKGVPRRYEFIGKAKNSKVYIDYAHHPTEIKSFIQTFKEEYEDNQIIFQPHTYSRTQNFFNEFIEVLSGVENLIIYKEYPAREKKTMGMSAKELYLEIKKNNPNVKYCSSLFAVINLIDNVDAVAFVGAGDINLVAEKVVKYSQNV